MSIAFSEGPMEIHPAATPFVHEPVDLKRLVMNGNLLASDERSLVNYAARLAGLAFDEELEIDRIESQAKVPKEVTIPTTASEFQITYLANKQAGEVPADQRAERMETCLRQYRKMSPRKVHGLFLEAMGF